MFQILAFATLALSGAQDAPAVTISDTLAPPCHSDGRVKNPRKFVEVGQGVQYEGEYSPPVGRQAEPEPTATTPVRYLSPSQRALPVIVRPAPIYVDEKAPAPVAEAVSTTSMPESPSYITAVAPAAKASEPVEEAPIEEESGSATGSTAIATYGALPNN